MGFSPARLLHALQLQLQHCQPHSSRLVLAYSGGLDSTVLLHAIAALRSSLEGFSLHAVHIHHGLQPEADDWVRHCQQQCDQLGIGLQVLAVQVDSTRGLSLEAAAREARYAALADYLADGDLLLTAQHADDQAETVLLQLLRGAGPRGLSAMPLVTRFARGWQLRPVLDVERARLHDWAVGSGLDWVEDSSNQDPRFDRNYLRHVVMPGLKTRWPALNPVLGRVAVQQAEAAELLDELAASDLQQAATGTDDRLRISALLNLSENRQRNALRLWLRRLGLPLPSRRKLEAVCRELLLAGQDRQPCVDWPGAELRRYRDELYAARAAAPMPQAGWTQDWDLRQPLQLPAGLGSLHALAATGTGLSREAVGPGVRVVFRSGGEQCRPAGDGHRRSLKKMFQDSAVAPWVREVTPLLYVGDQLAEVVGLCVCEPFQARPGEAALQINWHRDTASD